MMPQAQAKPGKLLLSPSDHTLILIDHQSQMAFATKSIDPVVLRNNAALVPKAAKESSVSTILTTVASKIFSGSIRHPETPSGSRRRGLRRLWAGR
jgi:nicotinamidase-related amidase